LAPSDLTILQCNRKSVHRPLGGIARGISRAVVGVCVRISRTSDLFVNMQMQFRFCAEHATANAITFTVRGAASSCDAGRLSYYETRGTHFALTAALQCFFNRMLAQSHCNCSARFHVSRGGTEYRKWGGNVDRRRHEDRGAEGTDWGEGP